MTPVGAKRPDPGLRRVGVCIKSHVPLACVSTAAYLLIPSQCPGAMPRAPALAAPPSLSPSPIPVHPRRASSSRRPSTPPPAAGGRHWVWRRPRCALVPAGERGASHMLVACMGSGLTSRAWGLGSQHVQASQGHNDSIGKRRGWIICVMAPPHAIGLLRLQIPGPSPTRLRC